jgi:hypothetical protein
MALPFSDEKDQLFISSRRNRGARQRYVQSREVTEQYHRAVEAFIKGDPEPQKPLWSQA